MRACFQDSVSEMVMSRWSSLFTPRSQLQKLYIIRSCDQKTELDIFKMLHHTKMQCTQWFVIWINENKKKSQPAAACLYADPQCVYSYVRDRKEPMKLSSPKSQIQSYTFCDRSIKKRTSDFKKAASCYFGYSYPGSTERRHCFHFFGLAGLGAATLVYRFCTETSIASCGTNGIRFAMQNVLMLS